MLDIKFIRENQDKVQKGTDAKNFHISIAELLGLDERVKQTQSSWESLQAKRNQLSKMIGKEKNTEARDALRSQVLNMKAELEQLQHELREGKAELKQMMLRVAQPAAEDVPLGKDDSFNQELRKVGIPRVFDFKPRDHVELGQQLGILDIERGVKLSGSRSYVLKGQGALLEMALLRYGMQTLVEKGFVPLSVPTLVNEQVMEGTGYFPLGADQAYQVEKDGMALVGTAEVSLCGLHMEETLNAEELPKRYMAQSSCYRREAGTYGRDTHGLYRVHQFQKLEMVVIAENDAEGDRLLHAELLDLAETLLQDLGLPYRVVYVCTGDLGLGQFRKHDIETWMPSRQGYGETHSCSSFLDFQSRRLGIRYKDKSGKRHYAYTLNNTYMAIPRLLLAILENFQTADGRVEIPQILRPYMMGAAYIGE
ncbi:MAG: serine--tRNA ligase [Zetaproteobacteria bacterium]|nr:serine--tRNA ligase [Zetaproteobacteria bacterium]